MSAVEAATWIVFPRHLLLPNSPADLYRNWFNCRIAFGLSEARSRWVTFSFIFSRLGDRKFVQWPEQKTKMIKRQVEQSICFSSRQQQRGPARLEEDETLSLSIPKFMTSIIKCGCPLQYVRCLFSLLGYSPVYMALCFLLVYYSSSLLSTSLVIIIFRVPKSLLGWIS